MSGDRADWWGLAAFGEASRFKLTVTCNSIITVRKSHRLPSCQVSERKENIAEESTQEEYKENQLSKEEEPQ